MSRAEVVESTGCSDRTWNVEVQTESMDYKPDSVHNRCKLHSSLVTTKFISR